MGHNCTLNALYAPAPAPRVTFFGGDQRPIFIATPPSVFPDGLRSTYRRGQVAGFAEVYQRGRGDSSSRTTAAAGCPRNAAGRWRRSRLKLTGTQSPLARNRRSSGKSPKPSFRFQADTRNRNRPVGLCQTILIWLTNENPIGNLMGAVSRMRIARIKRGKRLKKGRELC
jgi:hypothetical protein